MPGVVPAARKSTPSAGATCITSAVSTGVSTRWNSKDHPMPEKERPMTRKRVAQMDPIEHEIELALNPGAFIPDRACFSFVGELDEVAARIAKLKDTDPARAVNLCETFLAGCHEKAEEVDDSSGSVSNITARSDSCRDSNAWPAAWVRVTSRPFLNARRGGGASINGISRCTPTANDRLKRIRIDSSKRSPSMRTERTSSFGPFVRPSRKASPFRRTVSSSVSPCRCSRSTMTGMSDAG